jgi:RND family efflux transporter MFP subunit
MKQSEHTRAVALAAVAAAAVLAFTGCSDAMSSTASSSAPKPVIVTTVQRSDALEQRSFTATVRARVETDLGFRTAGKVVQRLVDVGDAVKAGQPIARLDAADYTLAVDAAADQWRAATVDAQQAASDEARMRRLLADGSVGAADHERQQSRADAAAARLDQAQRQLALARNRSGYTTLVAPYGGVVTGLRMEVGQVVGEGQPVVSIARDGEREIVADLPEAVASRVRELRASATPWPAVGEPIALSLRELSPTASATTRTFRVRYAIAPSSKAPAQRLALGSTAQLRLVAEGAPGVLLPAGAVVKSNGEAGVWLVDTASGRLAFRPVQVQAFEADAVRVNGLVEGSRVVTVGAQKLDAAMKVAPVERRSDDPAPALTAGSTS